ncbi:hypothetical protein EYC80_009247 [Monilinia laxa]|uniref:Pheromone-regulated membrane protein n=1 Tax=Monilinia laxa TaxID=61186 RepID=A0A5N6JX75_MONLA|nr:hypothetical protein EYC80_009247 [Monilinia laxa]
MGCFSRRAKVDDLRPEQKWDFISLNDFKSTSCLTPFAYAYLWISLGISTAVYGVDTFTAVNLLAFNRWSGEIQPKIPLNVSKWIFSGCIIASWINLGFEHLRAWRVMRRGAVAESYLDNLAVRLESVKMGRNGRGWRRFLVFAELTKSKKGTEYVALFTYFAFQSWIRVVFCQGPRQVINALTLYSVFQAKLDPTESSDVGDALLTFFKNVGILAEQQHQQAVILSGMIFTLVVWIFSALSLILAILFYLLFLWHYIPNQDGGLTGFCERKINGRLTKIVSAKVNKAIEEEERKRARADQKAAKKGEKVGGRQATIPKLFDPNDGDKLPDMPMLNRADTMATLPQYTSRPGTPSGNIPQTATFELAKLDQKRPALGRFGTGTSYSSNAPLVDNAGEMGRLPDLPPLDTDLPFYGPQRTNTGGSQGSHWQRGSPQGIPQGPPRMPSAMGDRGFTASPLSYTDGRNAPGFPGPQKQNTMDSYGRQIPPSHTPMGPGPTPSMGRRTPFDPAMQNPPNRMPPASEYGRQTPFHPNGQNPGRSSPAPGSELGGSRSVFNYNDQGRSSPAPGSEFGRRTPFDPSLQNDRQFSQSPSNMGQGYGQNPRRPPPASQGGYKTFNPSPMNSNSILSIDQREQNGGFNFGTSSPAQVGRLPDPIPRAATAGPIQMRSNGNRNEGYDEEMGSMQAPRRAATEIGGFNASGRPQQNQGHQRYGSRSGSGSGLGSGPWGGYR